MSRIAYSKEFDKIEANIGTISEKCCPGCLGELQRGHFKREAVDGSDERRH
jgi:hypothetical protein